LGIRIIGIFKKGASYQIPTTVLFYYAVEGFGKVILEKEIDNAISNKLNQIMMKTKKKGQK